LRRVEVAHALRTEREESLAGRGRVRDEPRDIDTLAGRRERAEALDAFLEQHGRAVEVAAPPVMETDADLQDAVVEAADRCARGAPEQLEGLVLLVELAGVELLDPSLELGWRRVGAARADRFVRRTWWRSLRRTRRLARAASGLRRARSR